MFGKRKLDDLSVEELEKALLIKRRQARLERFERLSKAGYTPNEALNGINRALDNLALPPTPPSQQPTRPIANLTPVQDKDETPTQLPTAEPSKSRKLMNMALLSLEVVAVVGLIGVLVASYFNLRELNDEVSLAQQNVVAQQLAPTPTQAPPIALVRLPGGHTPPTSPGGAVPDVPLHLQEWIQPTSSAATTLGPIEIAPGVKPPTRITIPKINVDAPIVSGVGWDDLKKGVGHLPGSANPGERGNLYLAAHNDIYGEIFRHLEDLAVGDEYFIYSGDEKFRYVVTERRIIDPADVDVMLPTTEPVSTLQTCYPYLIDTHRLVVIGELAE
ncbi:MAG: class D sortase [Anaerolineae bacterium]|nr:class D sortase [Anaerolineae bacterium]